MLDSDDIPKHAFVLCIFLVNRLTNYDRLAGKETCKGVLQEIRLNAETNIFFECSYAKRI